MCAAGSGMVCYRGGGRGGKGEGVEEDLRRGG